MAQTERFPAGAQGETSHHPARMSSASARPRVAVMRHSSRLDMSDPLAVWEDSATRPHDPPIDDFDLPRAAAKMYVRSAAIVPIPLLLPVPLGSFLCINATIYHWSPRGVAPCARSVRSSGAVFCHCSFLSRRLLDAGLRITSVWSSPYRRCLQTAAAACSTLGTDTVLVHHGLSEKVSAVARAVRDAGLDCAFIDTGDEPMYLFQAGKAAACGEGVAHADVVVAHAVDSGPGGFPSRVLAAMREVVQRHIAMGREGDVLMVTHGDGLAAVGSALASPLIIYSVDFCGTIVVDADFTIVHSGAGYEALAE